MYYDFRKKSQEINTSQDNENMSDNSESETFFPNEKTARRRHTAKTTTPILISTCSTYVPSKKCR